MTKAGQLVPNKPTMPASVVLMLRLRLILEEVFELAEALGIKITTDVTIKEAEDAVHATAYGGNFNLEIGLKKLTLTQIGEPDMVEATDALADISVVTVGTMSALGIADGTVLEEVDKNNLAKFRGSARLDKHGKFKKPKDHQPPDFHRVLTEQGWKTYAKS